MYFRGLLRFWGPQEDLALHRRYPEKKTYFIHTIKIDVYLFFINNNSATHVLTLKNRLK